MNEMHYVWWRMITAIASILWFFCFLFLPSFHVQAFNKATFPGFNAVKL
jgi:uncharacterized membrane protein